MAIGLRALADRLLQRRMLRVWTRAARTAESQSLSRLKSLRLRARQLRRRLDQVLFVADARLTLPLIGANAIARPLNCDWAYRPALWRGPVQPPGQSGVPSRTAVGDEATLYHDCQISELTYRQVRNTREHDIAPFGLRLDVFRFDGSFLSLVIDVPAEAAQGLQRRHLVRLTAIVETEKKIEIFARLNVRHGPNTEQIVRELPLGDEEVAVEFDLAYTKLNEKRVERLWLDLIFEGPEMNQIVLRDITLTRRPRAEF
jgi:hypothetical protein